MLYLGVQYSYSFGGGKLDNNFYSKYHIDEVGHKLSNNNSSADVYIRYWFTLLKTK